MLLEVHEAPLDTKSVIIVCFNYMVKLSKKGVRGAAKSQPPTDDQSGEQTEQTEQTEQRILEAAYTVFVRDGTAGARMHEIAEEAGVNQALLHYYFRNKERLAEAVFRKVIGQLLAPVIEILAGELGIEEKIELFVRAEIATLKRNPHLPGYIIGELAHQPARAPQILEALTGVTPTKLAKVFTRLRLQIEAESRAGRIRPISLEQLFINMLSLCVFPFAARPMIVSALGLSSSAFDRIMEERPDALVDFIMNAIRP